MEKVSRLFFRQCRYQHKWHSKPSKARPKVHSRRVFEAVTVPFTREWLEKPKPRCLVELKAQAQAQAGRVEEKNELMEEYEAYLVKKVSVMFAESAMVIVCQPMSMRRHEVKEGELRWRREGFTIHKHMNSIVRKHIEDTKWRNLEVLLCAYNLYISSPDIRLREFFAVAKKNKEYLALGGFVGNRFLSLAELEHYSTLPSIDQLLGSTVSLLSSGAARTSSLLTSQTQTLSRSLTELVTRGAAEHTQTDNVEGGVSKTGESQETTDSDKTEK